MEMIAEKETRLAHQEFNRELIALAAQLEGNSLATSSIPLIVDPENSVKKERDATENQQQNGGRMAAKKKPLKKWPGPVERRLKLNRKPKALSYDDAVELLGEFGDWIAHEVQTLERNLSTPS